MIAKLLNAQLAYVLKIIGAHFRIAFLALKEQQSKQIQQLKIYNGTLTVF
jgi:hypothetical protein